MTIGSSCRAAGIGAFETFGALVIGEANFTASGGTGFPMRRLFHLLSWLALSAQPIRSSPSNAFPSVLNEAHLRRAS